MESWADKKASDQQELQPQVGHYLTRDLRKIAYIHHLCSSSLIIHCLEQ